MSNTEWKDGAVCFATKSQWHISSNDGLLVNSFANHLPFDSLFYDDFQLNEMRVGDYIPARDLGNHKNYNSAVSVFELFSFSPYLNYNLDRAGFCNHGADKYCGLMLREYNIELVYNETFDLEDIKRKLTYPQLMAIGKLKQAMIECDEVKFDKNEGDSMKIASDRKFKEDDKPKLATQYLNECIAVQKQRGEQYDSSGTGERSFDAAAKAFNSLTGQNLKGSDVCLLLTCVKAVRQYSSPGRLHEDSLLDGVSYLSLWAEELNKELK